MSAFGGEADICFERASMSAIDPKRTLAVTGCMMNNTTVNGESHGNVDAQIAGKGS